jgi:hypothetical protein
MQERYCKNCKHPEFNHQHGMCNGQVRDKYPQLVLCDCKKFVPKDDEQ